MTPSQGSPAESSDASEPVRPSAWTLVRLVRRELNRRRLRMADLPPLPRRIGRVALGVTLLAAVALALYPLLESGEGLPWVRDGVPTGLTPLGFAVIFGGATIAFGLAAFAAPHRLRRPVAGALAVAGFVVLPTDISGGLGGGYSWPLASWSMFLGLSAVIGLAVAAVFGIPRSRHTLALLAVLPPFSALVTVLLLQGILIPQDAVGDAQAVPRIVLTEALGGVGALAGMFAILAIWAVIEYSKGLGAATAGIHALRPRWWWTVPAVALLKLGWIAGISAGWLPAAVTPTLLPSEVVAGESPLSLLLAAGFVTIVGIAAARRWLPAGNAELTTGVFWLLVIPIIAAFVLPTALLGVLAAMFRFALRLHAPPIEEIAAWQTGVSDWHLGLARSLSGFQPVLLDAAPLTAALTALAVAAYLWHRYPERAAAAPFLAAYGLWTLVPAFSLVFLRYGAPVWDQPPGADGVAPVLGNVHPITLDLGITALVAALGLLALRGRAAPIAPPLLLALLVASSVIAYGDQFTPAAWVTVLFWVGLAFPVFVQYGLDARLLNRRGPDRSARILFALAATLLAISASYAALTIGAVSPGDTTTAGMVRQLALMPLVLTFVLAYASQRAAKDAAADESVVAVPAPVPAG